MRNSFCSHCQSRETVVRQSIDGPRSSVYLYCKMCRRRNTILLGTATDVRTFIAKERAIRRLELMHRGSR